MQVTSFSSLFFGVGTWILTSILATAPVHADDSAPSPFTELFDDHSSAARWQIEKGEKPFGAISWSNTAPNRGLIVEAPGTSVALAKCDFGNDLFDFWFDTTITKGNTAFWRYNGFALALCSVPPGGATDHDLAVAVGFYQAGVAVALKKGPFYKPGLNIKVAPKFATVDVSTRYEMSMAGGGGESFSVQWPKDRIDGIRVRSHIQRLPGNLIRVELFTDDGDFSKPWWKGETKIPDKLASSPLNYIAVLTTEEQPDSIKPASPETMIQGRISNIRGWVGTQAEPMIQGYSAPDGITAGKDFTVTGTNFSPDVKVILNGTYCPVKSANAIQVVATASGLSPTGVNSLQVMNGNNLASPPYEPGIFAGHVLTSIEPYEALPEGGDIVTVHGAGFDASTQITFNGTAADVVKVLSPDAIQVKVPKGNAGVAAVIAKGFEGHPRFGYAPHPFMVFPGQAALEKKKGQFNDPAFAAYHETILKLAQAAPSNLESKDLNAGPDVSQSILAALGAWCLADDATFKEASLMAYRIQCEGVEGAYPTKANKYPGMLLQPLQRSQFYIMNGAAIAQLYDARFQELSPEERNRIEHYLDDYLANYNERIAAKDWWYDSEANPSNTIAVANGCAGTIALALRYSSPDNDTVALKAADIISKDYRSLLDDGGYVEGNLYWDYGMGQQITFGYFLENTLGNDHGLLSDARLQKMVHFMETQIGGDGNLITFNDTQPWLTGAIPCALAASRFDQPLMRWGCDEMARRNGGSGQGALMAFLLRDNKPIVTRIPDLPTVAALPKLNWGVMRSNPQAYGSGLVVGVKGVGGAQSHHCEEDAGSFVLQSRGESFFIDPGYFQATASEHTLSVIIPHIVANPNSSAPGAPVKKVRPVFNNKAPAPLSDVWESGNLRSITVDASQAYAVQVDQKNEPKDAPKPPPPLVPVVRRILVMDGEKGVVTLDQIEPLNSDDTVTAFYQCGFATDLLPNNAGFRINGIKSDLVALFNGPDCEYSLEKMKFSQNWIFSKLGVSWNRVSAPYKFTSNQPRIGIYLPVDKGANPPEPPVERTANHISVAIPGADTIEFQNNGGKWQAIKPG